MSWIKIDDNVYAEEAAPDPSRIVDAELLQQLILEKNMEIAMHDNEIIDLTARKESLQNEVDEINLVLGV